MSTDIITAIYIFGGWVKILARRQTKEAGTGADVVLMAYNGMYHNRIGLAKTMMAWGVLQ